MKITKPISGTDYYQVRSVGDIFIDKGKFNFTAKVTQGSNTGITSYYLVLETDNQNLYKLSCNHSKEAQKFMSDLFKEILDLMKDETEILSCRRSSQSKRELWNS